MSKTSRKGAIIVHGFMDSSNRFWWSRVEKMLEDYFDYVECLDLGTFATTFRSPIKYSRKIGQRCKELESNGYDKIHIISYSMGGISSRWFVEMEGGSKIVEELTTLGTPHKGSYTAYLGQLTKGAKDITPKSRILKKLNSTGLSDNIEYNIIYAEKDLIVIPKRNSKVFEESSNVSLYKMKCGHLRMIFDIKKLKKALINVGVINND